MKFNFEQLSFEAFLDVMRMFGRSPKLNVICSFSTILYFNHINLSRVIAPLWVEIDTLPDFFVQNAILNKFHLKCCECEGPWPLWGPSFIAWCSPVAALWCGLRPRNGAQATHKRA